MLQRFCLMQFASDKNNNQFDISIKKLIESKMPTRKEK